MAENLGGAARVRCGQWGFVAPEILHARDAAVSFRHAAYGSYAELHHRRCGGAVQAPARIQRAAPDRLGCVRFAGGKRSDHEQNQPASVGRWQYRRVSPGAATIRIQLRLAARNFDVRSRILQMESVAIPANAGEGDRVPQEEQGELVSEVPDRAGERTGDRRLLLAP